MPNRLARKTIIEIQSALEDKQTAAITEIIQLIQQLAAKAFSISIGELSQLVGRDPTITEKVISSANTLGYNPGGLAVSTISDAIHTVGFEKIRNLAISLMLAENAAQNRNTYEQRNAAALSVCSGMLAERLKNRPLGEDADTELFFVCASLRNYGRLLLSTFMVERYRLARSHALDMPEDDAFREIFGLTTLELGQEILQRTNLPKNIMASLRPVRRENLMRAAVSQDEETLILSDMAVGLSTVVFDESIGPDRFNDSISNVLSRYSIAYPVSIESVTEALLSVDETMSTLNRTIGLSERQSPASVKLQARINGVALPQPPPYARISARLKQKTVDEMDPDERKTYSDATFAPAVESIDSCLVPGSKVALENVFKTVSSSFKQAAHLENCLIFVREEFDPDCLSARYGVGDLFSKVKNRPIVSPSKRDIFSICLARKEDILIEDTNAGKIRSVVPDWIHSAGDTSSFIILPVNHEKTLKALIVGTVSHEKKIDLSPFDLRHLRSIRGKISKLYEMISTQAVTTV
ncbi:HDOD domain-containing protein [Pelagicoccus mobilis]|uniref:HDOD domain-containing protein n=1 Tax=Pelagicoccus mobilis TaxID=415221 RepID=A0A934S4I6_9BACT|nr:HDOD domain-containing protein [Pelagicoccus mobilis]MBK1879219.1 HDOD domain-containing protein [Pelagicoccus mobilis]